MGKASAKKGDILSPRLTCRSLIARIPTMSGHKKYLSVALLSAVLL
ncbi:DsbA family protein, partial [Acinetobacter baumannii]|nr:DsbA family protein [Acinetobacter baumannii]